MEINREISRKITFLSFVMALFVVLRHSVNQDLLFHGLLVKNEGSAFYFQNLLSDVWGQIAVPFFFVVSGFFMIGKFQKGFKYYKKLCIKKFYGLVIPYLFWACLSFIAMFLVQNIPGISKFFNSDLILQNSFENNLYDILHARYVGQFWYIQHLIVLTIASPILYWYSEKTKWIGLLPIFLAYCLDITIFNYLSFSSVFYFLCGGLFSKSVGKTNIQNGGG